MLDFTPVLYVCINKHVFTLISCHRMIISYQPCRCNTGMEEQKSSFTKFLFSKQQNSFFPGHIDYWLRLKPDLDNAIVLEEFTSGQPHIFNSCITILHITSLQNLRLVFENVALAFSFQMPCRGIWIHWDIHWPATAGMKLNKSKCQILHLGWSN